MKKAVIAMLAIALFSCNNKYAKDAHVTARNKEWKFIFERRKLYYMHLKDCDTLTVSFIYNNFTGHVQNIDTIKTTCSCTNVHYEHRPIKPGEKGYVSINVDIDNYDGFFSKSVGVYFHNQPPVILTILGKNETRRKLN